MFGSVKLRGTVLFPKDGQSVLPKAPGLWLRGLPELAAHVPPEEVDEEGEQTSRQPAIYTGANKYGG